MPEQRRRHPAHPPRAKQRGGGEGGVWASLHAPFYCSKTPHLAQVEQQLAALQVPGRRQVLRIHQQRVAAALERRVELRALSDVGPAARSEGGCPDDKAKAPQSPVVCTRDCPRRNISPQLLKAIDSLAYVLDRLFASPSALVLGSHLRSDTAGIGFATMR